MCLRLYTDGFLIISIISAVFGQQSAGAVPRRVETKRREAGDRGEPPSHKSFQRKPL
jgi:hypothetical protein